MFQVSPGVNVSEIDQTTGIPAVSSTGAALAGVFRWGPVNKRFSVTSEPDLVSKTSKPTDYNAETWFTAASFLAYGNDLTVVRVTDGASAMAVFANTLAPNASTQTVLNSDVYDDVTFSSNVAFVAKYPGALGNSLRVSVCDSPTAYKKLINLVANSDIAPTSNLSITVGSKTGVVSIGFAANGTQITANAQAYSVKNSLQPGDNIKVGNASIGYQYLKISNIGSVTGNSTVATFNVDFSSPYKLYSDWSSSTLDRWWEFYNVVTASPTTSQYVQTNGNTAAVDQIHLVVVDDGGQFTGVPGSILEVFNGLSRATDSKTLDGNGNFYHDVINTKSKYLWWATDPSTSPTANAQSITTSTSDAPISIRLAYGSDGSDENTISLGEIAQGYDLFKSTDDIDVSLVMTGKSRDSDGSTLANYIIDNIITERKDCVSFISPPKSAVVNNVGFETDSIIAFVNDLRSTSYAFMDSGYKYMYDKYNDAYRWVPLNGDMAGLAARTDQTNDAWWSFAGSNRGQIKNVVKLAWNPKQAERDTLYKNAINPVITQKGTGTVLFGDKTLLQYESAFGHINVRRLFIVIEKAIASYSKALLFEFNDEFTRSQFRSIVVPYLRDIVGRRGIADFQVVCDETNNTPEVIDANQFVGDIYIKPNRSINTIQLNFVAVNGDAQFTEIVGQS